MDGSRERHITTVPPHQCYRLNFWYEQDHVHLLCKASPCFSHSHKLCALTILSPPQDDRVLRRCVKQLVQTGKRKEHKKYLAGEISNWESINQNAVTIISPQRSRAQIRNWKIILSSYKTREYLIKDIYSCMVLQQRTHNFRVSFVWSNKQRRRTTLKPGKQSVWVARSYIPDYLQ